MATTAAPAGWTVPEGYTFDNVDRCRACGASMAWCITRAGKKAPLNADGTSHFATCPQADEFRRRTRDLGRTGAGGGWVAMTNFKLVGKSSTPRFERRGEALTLLAERLELASRPPTENPEP